MLVVVGSVVRHWTRAVAASPEGVIILSPYVTSRTAETVLNSTGGRPARLYTTFDARVFSSGASRISTLKRVAQDGHAIFHIAGLHAKLVLTRECVTVGSQNLTGRGAVNREITAILRDAAVVDRLRADLDWWISAGEPISLEQIIDMEKSLPPLRRAFRQFLDASYQADQEVQACERARKQTVELQRKELEEVEKRREEEERRSSRLRELLAQSERSSRSAAVRVFRNNSYETLLCRGPMDKLAVWTMPDGSIESLDRRMRYLIVARHSGRLAWAPLNETRLTRFGSGLTNDSFSFGGRQVHLEFNAVAAPLDRDANVELQLRLKLQDPPVCLRGWFEIDTVDLHEGMTTGEPPGDNVQWILEQLRSRRAELLAELTGRLLRPFRYTKNSKGLTVSEFLGTIRKYFEIRLYRRAEHPFLVVE